MYYPPQNLTVVDFNKIPARYKMSSDELAVAANDRLPDRKKVMLGLLSAVQDTRALFGELGYPHHAGKLSGVRKDNTDAQNIAYSIHTIKMLHAISDNPRNEEQLPRIEAAIENVRAALTQYVHRLQIKEAKQAMRRNAKKNA